MSITWRAAVIVVLLIGLSTGRESSQKQTSPAEESANQFVIGNAVIRLPEGVFLLIRKEQKIGAIRFTMIEPGALAGTGKAIYESYFPADSSGSFRSPGIRRYSGKNDLKPLKGIGRFAFQFGADRVRVGDWSFRSAAPGMIGMWPYRGTEKDHGYEFAPTSARSVEEIDASDKRLKWLRFDRNADVTLKVVDLPK